MSPIYHQAVERVGTLRTIQAQLELMQPIPRKSSIARLVQPLSFSLPVHDPIAFFPFRLSLLLILLCASKKEFFLELILYCTPPPLPSFSFCSVDSFPCPNAQRVPTFVIDAVQSISMSNPLDWLSLTILTIISSSAKLFTLSACATQRAIFSHSTTIRSEWMRSLRTQTRPMSGWSNCTGF